MQIIISLIICLYRNWNGHLPGTPFSQKREFRVRRKGACTYNVRLMHLIDIEGVRLTYRMILLWKISPILNMHVHLMWWLWLIFRFVTPLIPVDWIKECDIETEDQVISKSASQGSESNIILLLKLMLISSLTTSPQSCTIVVALGVLFSISVIALIVVSIVLGLVCYEKGPRYQRLNSDTTASNA